MRKVGRFTWPEFNRRKDTRYNLKSCKVKAVVNNYNQKDKILFQQKKGHSINNIIKGIATPEHHHLPNKLISLTPSKIKIIYKSI
jgi:hypothetical protein